MTYHGPGQLVGYPVRRVGRAIRQHVEGMIGALQAFLGTLGIESRWDEAAPGLWTAKGKIAALGVDARGGVTMHGFSLNLSPNLRHYDLIVPCGERRPVTSVEAVLGRAPRLAEAAPRLASDLGRCYGVELVAVDAADVGLSGIRRGDDASDREET